MTKYQMDTELREQNRKVHLLEEENEKLKSLLDAELQAKENGCHRGNYCRSCIHGIIVDRTCYCTFGQCDHYEKDPKYNHHDYI